MEKIRILQLSPRFPFPMDDGGKIGIANITIELAKQGAEIDFFTFDNYSPADVIDMVKPYAVPVIYPHSTENTPLRIIISFLLNYSLYLKKHNNFRIRKFLRDYLQNKKFDIIQAEHTCMAPLALYLKEIYQIPVGLKLHNIEWTIWHRYADVLPKLSPRRVYIQQQANLLKARETELISKADICFTVTDDDRLRALEMVPDANVVASYAGVNLDEWQPDDSIIRNPFELVIATTFHWVHNRDAVKWFIEKVLPLVKNKIPEIKFTIIGKEAPEWLNNYKELGISVEGYVPKVQPYFNRANVFISPLFVGGGVRIKILEALSMELPVVASPIAAEGINARCEEGLFVCRDAGSFAASIINLCNNFESSRKLGRAGRKYILENNTWEKSAGIFIKNYKKILNLK